VLKAPPITNFTRARNFRRVRTKSKAKRKSERSDDRKRETKDDRKDQEKSIFSSNLPTPDDVNRGPRRASGLRVVGWYSPIEVVF
jgi:hypothetical protein